ncbi:MAG: hypothetical protein AAGA58_15405 [Verrucomicrobiota bacterium]
MAGFSGGKKELVAGIVTRSCFLIIAVIAVVGREQFGVYGWVVFACACIGFLILQIFGKAKANPDDREEALRVAGEAIKAEAARLDTRRAEIEKVLMAYAEWMEFPDFEEVRDTSWNAPAKTARDAEVAALLESEADQFLQRMSDGAFQIDGQFSPKLLLLDLWDFTEKVARIYNPDAQKPLLETNLADLLKSINRASIQILLFLEEIPVLDVKEWNIRQTSDNIRKATKAAQTYRDLEKYINPLKYVWQGSKVLLATNPLTAAGWIIGSNLAIEGGKKLGKRAADAWVLSFVRQTLGIIAWETASIYDRTHRFRNPEWVYGIELAHLMSEIPLEPKSLRTALKEIGGLALSSTYDRIFLYRCVAQHVSPKPERFVDTDLLAEDTKQAIIERLNTFAKKQIANTDERKLQKWRRNLDQRLPVILNKKS